MAKTLYKGAPKAGLYTRLSVDDGYTDRESNSITSHPEPELEDVYLLDQVQKREGYFCGSTKTFAKISSGGRSREQFVSF